ncbi:MAG TPA: gamma-glutamyl-gamma-aminobutyrate hydrolase family protein [Bacteroidales bacterium]|nr:gamma-glutamyl-gamma-aminobutyrate hydrolase family protein [Bacteroidales bacterium]
MGNRKVIIGVSKLSPNYADWLGRLQEDQEIVDLYELPEEALSIQVKRLSGILLSGGSDIDPRLYDRPEDIAHCRNIDTKRDNLETKLIHLAFASGIPVLGICRGLQILNVVHKGSLWADIPFYVNSAVIHQNKEDVFHPVSIKRDSVLYKVTKSSEGLVNSSHHQAVSRIAEGFNASAFSSDGLPEAIEADRDVHPFCLAVQWHPERMEIENPLSGLLGKAFTAAAAGIGEKLPEP